MSLSASDREFIEAAVKGAVTDAMGPIVLKLANHHQTLYGPTEQNGLRGDMSKMKEWKQTIDLKWAKVAGMVIGGAAVVTAVVNFIFK